MSDLDAASSQTSHSAAENRRPIASRGAPWAVWSASRLAALGVSPNAISVTSVAFAAIGAALIADAAPWALVIAAACVQARLVCNLLDGMVAIEGGKASPVGALYNEFPDRIADTLFLVPAGYAAGWPWLGWATALAAALTAYVRVFGASLDLGQDFSGVMAKQRRMAALTAGLVIGAVERAVYGTTYALTLCMAVVLAGSLMTCITRTRRIARALPS